MRIDLEPINTWLDYRDLFDMRAWLVFPFPHLSSKLVGRIAIFIPRPSTFSPLYGWYRKSPKCKKLIRMIAFFYLLFVAPFVASISFLIEGD